MTEGSTILGRAYVQIRPDTRGFQSDVEKNVGGAFRKVAAVAAGALAAAGVGSILKDSISKASDLSETLNKSNVIFGSNAKNIEKWAGTASKNFGLSKAAALEAAAGLGNMLSQLGYTGDEAAKASTDTVKLAADLGSFSNLETGDVLDRIGAAMRGEFDSLQLLIPNINAARVEQEAMAATGKTVASELTAQEKATATLAIVQKDGAMAANDFAETSDGLANRTKIAAAQFDDMSAKLGTALLPAVTNVMSFISTTALPALGNLGDKLVNDVIPAFKNTAEWIDSNKAPILSIAGLIAAVMLPHFVAMGVSSTINAAKVVASFVATQAGAIGAAAVHSAQVLRMVGSWVLLSAQSLLHAARVAAAFVIAMGPIGWVIATIVGLTALIIANWETIKEKTSAIWSSITGAISDKATAAKDFVTDKFDAMRDGVVGIFTDVRDTVGALWDDLLGIVKKPVRAVLEFINDKIIDNVNIVTKKFGLDIPRIRYSFATGGVVPGLATPGRDNHIAAVGSGEAIMRSEFTNAVGPSGINALNQAARIGGTAGVKQLIASGGLGFASGGIMPKDSGGPLSWISDKVSDGINWAKDGVENLLAKGASFALKALIEPAAGWITKNVDNPLVSQLVSGAMKRLASKAAEWGTTKDNEQAVNDGVVAGAGGGGALGSGWTSIFNPVKGAFPQARANSTLRPGDPDYHGRGKAVDLGQIGRAGGMGHPYLAAMHRWLYDNYGGKLAELIYYGAGVDRPSVKNGRNHTYNLGTQRGHFDHVHAAVYDDGGILDPGMTLVNNKSGKPEGILTNEQLGWLRDAALTPAASALINGDIIIQPSAGETTRDQLGEVSFQLRRLQRGGAHTRR